MEAGRFSVRESTRRGEDRSWCHSRMQGNRETAEGFRGGSQHFHGRQHAPLRALEMRLHLQPLPLEGGGVGERVKSKPAAYSMPIPSPVALRAPTSPARGEVTKLRLESSSRKKPHQCGFLLDKRKNRKLRSTRQLHRCIRCRLRLAGLYPCQNLFCLSSWSFCAS